MLVLLHLRTSAPCIEKKAFNCLITLAILQGRKWSDQTHLYALSILKDPQHLFVLETICRVTRNYSLSIDFREMQSQSFSSTHSSDYSPLKLKSMFFLRPNMSVDFRKSWDFSSLETLLQFQKHQYASDTTFQKFKERVKGKNALVVGPAVLTNEHMLSDDNFDLIVRVNYVANKANGSTSSDRYPDIVYFNGGKASYLRDLNQQVGIDSWIVLKEKSCIKFFRDVNVGAVRILKNHISPVGAESFNLLPLIILDLLVADVASLTLCGFDLYTGRYDQSYFIDDYFKKISPMSKGRGNFDSSAVIHNPFLQYDFLSSLWRHGFFSCDDRLQQLMQAGPRSYARELDFWNDR